MKLSVAHIVTAIAISALLGLAGCTAIEGYDPATNFHFRSVRVLTSTTIGDAKVDLQTPTTHETFTLTGYGSKSEVTGADIANIAATIVKAMVAIP